MHITTERMKKKEGDSSLFSTECIVIKLEEVVQLMYHFYITTYSTGIICYINVIYL